MLRNTIREASNVERVQEGRNANGRRTRVWLGGDCEGDMLGAGHESGHGLTYVWAGRSLCYECPARRWPTR